MGKPAMLKAWHPMMNKIVIEEGTRGTETSKYPEEKKENSISLVVASEEERGQTSQLRLTGVVDHQREVDGESNTVGKPDHSG